MAQPVLLLGAEQRAEYGEFTLSRIAAAHPVVLVGTAPPPWARPFLSGHIAADPRHETQTTNAVTRYAARHPVRGLLTWGREHLATAARIAERLGLPGLPSETAVACADRASLSALLTRLNGPPAGAKDMTGPLVFAETVVLDDEVRIAALTRTALGPPPARLPLRHQVHAHDGLLHNRFCRQAVERTVRALGLSHTVARVGLRLTERGPRVADVVPHLPGDLVPLLVELATGVDLVRAAATLATGRHPDLTPTRQRAAAIQFAYPAATGRLTRLDLDPAVAHEPSAERMLLTKRAGDAVTAAPHANVTDRLAHWVVSGDDTDECAQALRRMAVHLTAAILPTSDLFAA
ncbi:hypothetical protein [Streptomyces sp. NPDC002676]